ncbi:MAG: hypothetical protein F6K24_54565 [Okeania sp. SIO2D1]|nr:hypothetical protein [Okeania sp. SIO2D1]
MIGDIILYQSRGQEIRRLIFSLIEEAESPVVLLAHSLGGIACVDLLIQGLDLSTPDENLLVREQLNKVKLLVTAGSQAPFLYEIGALYSREYGEALPDYFPEWLNFYHKWDFLSYIGADVFPQPNKITDIEIDDEKRFLESHNVYWENNKTWDEIALRLL